MINFVSYDQLRELRIWEQAQGVTAFMLSPAGLPSSPVSPRPVRNLMVAALLGLIAGIGIACLREMMDDRVHSAEEAERLVGLPILGRIPTFPARTPLLISEHGDSPVKESYRRLRAGISFAGNPHPIGSLLVTSATAGEGKSTTAANLAVAAALQGRRVILVDADLRGPSLPSLFNLRADCGLSEVLTDEIPLSKALHLTDIQDLLWLPAGSPVPKTAELLSGPRMTKLLEELRGLADLVILDTPPCLPVTDAEVLGSRVDGAILVVGLGQTDKTAVRMAQQLLEQAQVNLLGVVLNRVKPGDHGYYYRYRPRTSTSAAGLKPAHPALLPEAPMSARPVPTRDGEDT
jgi:polysaccharide biosynthesis transport protein